MPDDRSCVCRAITTLTIDAAGQDLYNGVDTEKF